MDTKIKLSGHWPSHMDRDEARVCNRLITAILERGYLVRVRDFEVGEVMCQPTKDRASIQKETAATGGTLYDLIEQVDPDRAVSVGSILLIHGNGEDVICDATWSSQRPEMEAVLDLVMEHAEVRNV